MPEQPDLDALGAEYREAKAAVPAHLRKQADAELAQVAWLKRHRGVPSHVLYDPRTGEPRDPDLRKLEDAMYRAERDVAWCRAVEVAAMEAYKGETIAEILARNEAHRAKVAATAAKARSLGEDG